MDKLLARPKLSKGQTEFFETWSILIGGYVDALRRGGRLARLVVPGEEQAGVRNTLDLSYPALPAAAQPMLRLLGLAPVVDVTAESAAVLAGVSVPHAQKLLDRLAAAHLVNRSGGGRFTLHDLVREYAAGRAEQEEQRAQRRAAVGQLTDWYLYCADAAADRL
jgi:hypothetical protein